MTAEVGTACSATARDVQLSPIGSSGSYRGYLLVEWPLPWPKDVAHIEPLADIVQGMSVAGIRIQLVVPAAPQVVCRARLYMQRTRAGRFWRYQALEPDPDSSLGAEIDRLLLSSEEADDHRVDDAPVELLVCTHGRRDACCGSLGTTLAQQLATVGLGDGVRVARTSHTGGHRFAPTFLILPQGTSWGFADVTLAGQVLRRSVPFSSVADRYRGCVGLPNPQVQLLEREVLYVEGWDLFDEGRAGYLTGETTAGGGEVVRLETATAAWEGIVQKSRTISIPACRKPPTESPTLTTEWSVSDVRSVG